MTNKNTKSWPFILTDYESVKFVSIPKKTIKYNLKIRSIELHLLEVDEKILLFRFKFGAVSIIVNMINRSFNWAKEFVENDKLTQVYPNHYKKNVENNNS